VESPVATIKPTIVVVVEVAYIALLGAEFSAVSGIGMLVTLPPLRNSRSLAVAQHCYNGGHFYTFEKKIFSHRFWPLASSAPPQLRGPGHGTCSSCPTCKEVQTADDGFYSRDALHSAVFAVHQHF